MRLILARHGETIGNVNRINQGQDDGELTENGKRQSILLGERLSHESIDAIYVSDLGRCVDTAEHIIRHHKDTPVYYEPMIRERSLGVLEGSRYGDVARHAEKEGVPIIKYRPKGGESIEDVKARAKRFIGMVLEKYHGKTVLVVSHGQFIANIILYVLGLDDAHYDEYKHENTAISIIAVSEKPIMELHRCTRHLKD